MLTKDALQFFGSKTKLASAAGVRLPSVYKWGALVPEARASRLQSASNGVLQYDPAIYDQHKENRKKVLNHENHTSS